MVHNQKSKSIEILKKSLNEVVQEAVTILSNFLKEFDISYDFSLKEDFHACIRTIFEFVDYIKLAIETKKIEMVNKLMDIHRKKLWGINKSLINALRY